MAQKYKVSEGLQSMLNAIKAKNKKTTLEDFNNHGITNAQDSVYGKGCIITFPDLDEIDEFIDFEEFTTNGRTSRAPYVACNSTEGPKKVYLSQMTRTVMPYVEKDTLVLPVGQGADGDYDGGDANKVARFISSDLGETFIFDGYQTGKTE